MTERTTLDIVGIGPGAPQYVTMTVRDLVAAADVVAGFRTVLQVVADHIRGEAVTLDYRNQADGIRMLDQ
ncbi:MAG: SAM-dependent methyltransferase, partial [Chloroflexi bacterium]|nr:SAM-dependent methyltransferase [Chloroflexota bacterium]